MKLAICFISTFLWLGISIAAETKKTAPEPEFDFPSLWSIVLKNAPALRAAKEESEAAQIGSDRAGRHWYPHLYAAGKAFGTNDPSTSFMYALEQRQIGVTDFAPSTLNQPGNSFFEQGTLGLDLPLFEGGLQVAKAQAASLNAEGKSWEAKAQEIKEYASVSDDFAALLVLADEHRQLLSLKESVSGILEHYNIGSKSNPVGYSGLLGLRNLQNRIDGIIIDNEAKTETKRFEINAMAAGLPETWRPKPGRAKEFLREAFPISKQLKSNPRDSVSAAVLAARADAGALERAKDGEKARFLPRIGLFAQGDLYGGSRAGAMSYASGAYLQWDLFLAPNFGAIGQSEHEAAAAEARAEDLQNKMRSEFAASEAGAAAAERSLVLLDESAKLLEEQTHTARGLFRNGSINALQLVEVLNRRADLLVSRAEAELNLARLKTTLFLTSVREGMPYGHTD